VTKEELADELIEGGYVDITQTGDSDYDDVVLSIIEQYIYDPDKCSNFEWADRSEQERLWGIQLQRAIFLASNCSKLSQWFEALERERLHARWKVLQGVNEKRLSPEELEDHGSELREIERAIESDESAP
jgi:hypothetical protein